jgi:predicted nucleic acid-binding protein
VTARVAYLDSSAFVKLVGREPESGAFVRELRRWGRRTASELLRVEVLRAARRHSSPVDPLRLGLELLRGVTLQPLTGAVMQRAVKLDPVQLGTLDALHLATALDLGSQLGAFFTYDRRLGAAAREAGLPVLAPGS